MATTTTTICLQQHMTTHKDDGDDSDDGDEDDMEKNDFPNSKNDEKNQNNKDDNFIWKLKSFPVPVLPLS